MIAPDTRLDTPAALAHALAGRARRFRARVLAALSREDVGGKTLSERHARFSRALAPMTDEAFADAYAQTLTYGLLSARWLTRGSDRRFTPANLPALLPATSPFLRDLLLDLLHVGFDDELRALLDDITGLLADCPVAQIFTAARDPSIHFYQDFLDCYDPRLRKARGVYYTPDEVVAYMVDTVDRLLRTRFGLRLGLADPITWAEYGASIPAGTGPDAHVVQVLDPATGTGTFLLHTLRRIFATMRAEYVRLGHDDEAAATAWRGYVRADLLPRVHGFELMMAPYTVAHLRLGLALAGGLAEEQGLEASRWGFCFGPEDRLRVMLTDTLAPDAGPLLAGEHVAEEARQAGRLKRDTAVLVVLGNPPYERISADTDAGAGWLLRGEAPGRVGGGSLFDDIRDVAREHTIFSHLRSLSDRYVYFWRWVLWKCFEQPESPGVVALITNSTWLAGPGFMGLRKLVRVQAEEIWTVDLGGDNRGTHPEANVFNIETPVAITTLVRTADRPGGGPAAAYYRKVCGDSALAKLAALRAGQTEVSIPASTQWLDSLIPPTGTAAWLAFAPLVDLFPWQQPGCLVSRTWPIAPDIDTLQRRWRCLLEAPVAGRAALFATAKTGRNIFTRVPGYPPLASLPEDASPEPVVRYWLRSFDRQWVLADPRLLKTESPSLWRSVSERQVFLCSLMSIAVAAGPAMTVAAGVPDFHHFRGSYGGKDVLPLYRDAAATRPNVTEGLLDRLAAILEMPAARPEALAAYVYALLSAPRYQQRFADALRTRGPRVPMTRDPQLWARAVALGERLLWLHTYATRYRDPDAGRAGTVPEVPGIAWARPVARLPQKPAELRYEPGSQTLHIGDGVVVGVRPEVWAYEVSGMPVVRKWLGYRTRDGAGKAASSGNGLDAIRQDTWPAAWSDELLELLRVLTLTLEMHPQQAALLDEICEGPLIAAAELPAPTAAERKEPRAER